MHSLVKYFRLFSLKENSHLTKANNNIALFHIFNELTFKQNGIQQREINYKTNENVHACNYFSTKISMIS